MSTASAPKTGTTPGLQEQIRRLVAELRDVREQRTRETGYRGLVVRAVEAEMPAADFQQALRAGGMKASHASELATIREHPKAAAEFTRTKSPLSFRVALRLARGTDDLEADRPSAEAPEERQRAAWEKLVRLGTKLASLQPADQVWSIDCGLFTLSFYPATATAIPIQDPVANVKAARMGAVLPVTVKSSEPTAPKLVIPLAPETTAKLAKLARRSGLNKSETAGLLLERAPLAEINELVRPLDPIATEPDLESVFELQRGKSGNLFGLQRGKISDALGLQRRQHPTRTPADVWRVPVAVPKTVTEAVSAIANKCGLAAGETANLLLEPDPRGRFRALGPALAHATNRRSELVVQDTLRALPTGRRARTSDQTKPIC